MRTHAHSEATRLLCAGAHLNAGFRQRVVDELVGHVERPVAPSLGVDVRPVLAHALRARRQEAQTALALLAVWAGFFLVSLLLAWDVADDSSGGDAGVSAGDLLSRAVSVGDADFFSLSQQPTDWVLFYATVVFWLWAGRTISGRETRLYGAARPAGRLRSAVRRSLGRIVTYAARLYAVGYWITALGSIVDNPFPVIFPLLMAAVIWLHRIRVTALLREQLSRESFATAPQPELPYSEHYRRIGEAIDREQHAQVTLYDANRPFIGAGVPYKPWSFALELRRKKESPGAGRPGGVPPQTPGGAAGPVAQVPPQPGESPQPQRYPVQPPYPGTMLNAPIPETGPGRPQPDATAETPGQAYADGQGPPADHLSSRHVLEMIMPKLVALRDATARTSRDSLRGLEIEEFVYLPAGAGRQSGVYSEEQIQQHLLEAAADAGEARRHFLRIRVGSWHEQVVVSLLVRVHTQGGMLVLEVVPHVLGPVVEEFREVDAIVERGGDGSLREGVLALLASPTAIAAAGIGAAGTLLSVVREWLASPEHAAPDAPLVSVRELASTEELSLFQEMDVSRYIKTVQDRIASGVRDALEENGFRTDRFEQQIVNVRDGGVYIEEMSGGAVATGERGQAQHLERSPA
ncbi:hypothetical protein K378_00586 [Streptomyces sp. Amel2xB2]|uniref:proline-rich domain-containing protein n=1 Tax=Streptomyces sp. Amel2xB2 TaxID=1305829 RepID=UPI000DB973B4|nr:proline-rich domain-containing protein [Streptomyces sp. Amel2xB2]RAJ71766.1 hypothetical protein K378_00586 [Streptomyces sp. Amel2xB2]